MNKIIAIFACMFLFGCDSVEESYSDHSNRIIYFKDHRVNLCYGGRNLGFQTGVMTNVPCEAVKNHLVNP